jgi:hypothetical protein
VVTHIFTALKPPFKRFKEHGGTTQEHKDTPHDCAILLKYYACTRLDREELELAPMPLG